MKKIILSLLAGMAFAAYVQAQEFKFGVSAGANFFTVNGVGSASGSGGGTSSSLKVSYIPGFHLGAYSDILFSERFGLRPELLFTQKGDREEYSFDFNIPPVSSSTSVKARSHISYLEIPVQAKISLNDQFHVLAGPYAAFLLGLKVKSESTVTSNGVSSSSDDVSTDKSGMNAVDFGLCGGLGYQLENGLNFRLKSSLGLSDIDDAGGSGSNEVHKNIGFMIGVGYSF